MATLNIQIGNDTIEGKPVGSNKLEFWLGSKRFSIESANGTQTATEVLLRKSTTLIGKQLRPNVWSVEHWVYEGTAWGSVSIDYNIEFNVESMTAIVKEKTTTDA